MIDYERLAKAEIHPTRMQLLEELEKARETGAGEVSTATLCKTLDGTTVHLTYHLGVLEGKGLVELTRIESVGPEVHRWFRLVDQVVA